MFSPLRELVCNARTYTMLGFSDGPLELENAFRTLLNHSGREDPLMKILSGAHVVRAREVSRSASVKAEYDDN